MTQPVYFEGRSQSIFTVVGSLWGQYIGEKTGKPEHFLQQLHMLQESIRRCMRSEHDSYLNGRCTAGRVSETKGHASLLGKIIKQIENDSRFAPVKQVVCPECFEDAHSQCIGQGCYCDCQMPR